jgi:hypothetical protein
MKVSAVSLRSTTRMVRSAGTTMGRCVSACEQMGASTVQSTEGWTMGPPADSAYAVEPVGVERMTPSAL